MPDDCPVNSMPGEIKLLLVDDDREKRFLIALSLNREFVGLRLTECESGAAAIEHLQRESVDAIITDNSMSPINGLELLDWVRARDPQLPVIMVTGNSEIEPLALQAGASAVLPSLNFNEIGTVLRRFLSRTD
ncbi:MAG: response regulator [Opitutus sp.]